MARVDLSQHFKEYMHVAFSASNGKGSAAHIVHHCLTFGLSLLLPLWIELKKGIVVFAIQIFQETITSLVIFMKEEQRLETGVGWFSRPLYNWSSCHNRFLCGVEKEEY